MNKSEEEKLQEKLIEALKTETDIASDKIRDAIESRRSLEEVKGMNSARRTARYSIYVALFTVVALIAQSIALIVQHIDLKNEEEIKEEADYFSAKKNLMDSVVATTAVVESEIKRLEQDKLDLVKQKKNIEESNHTMKDEFNQRRRELENGIELDKEKLEDDVARLKSQIDQKQQELKLLTNQLNSGSVDLANSKLVDELINNIERLQSDLAVANNRIESLTENNNVLANNYKEIETRMGKFSTKNFQNLRREEPQEFEEYTVTLKNVGNIIDNIDISISRPGIDPISFANVKEKTSSCLLYDEKLFILDVEKAFRAQKRNDEKATFRINLFRKKHWLVY